MSKERAETHVSHGPPNPPCSLGMTMVASIVWWLLQSVDFTYQLSKIFIGRRLQASSQLTSLRGVVCQIRFKTDLPSHAAVVKKILFWIVPFHGFCTFGSGTPNSVVLGDSRRSACSAARLTS